jgi:lipopolysaccharide export system protein LptA
MRYIFFLLVFLVFENYAEELKIKADTFSADQKKGLSIFSGHVYMVKGDDELNASKVIIFTDNKNKPTKFIAKGSVSFVVTTKEKVQYSGVAQKVIYAPTKKEYQFFGNVHLQQLNDKKEILGDEVILKINTGKAYAKGIKAEPVIMIFDIPDEKDIKEKK